MTDLEGVGGGICKVATRREDDGSVLGRIAPAEEMLNKLET